MSSLAQPPRPAPIFLPETICNLLATLEEENGESLGAVVEAALIRYDGYIEGLDGKTHLRYKRPDETFADVDRHMLPEPPETRLLEVSLPFPREELDTLVRRVSMFTCSIAPAAEIVRRAIRLYALDIYEHKIGSRAQLVFEDQTVRSDNLHMFSPPFHTPLGRELKAWAESLSPGGEQAAPAGYNRFDLG